MRQTDSQRNSHDSLSWPAADFTCNGLSWVKGKHSMDNPFHWLMFWECQPMTRIWHNRSIYLTSHEKINREYFLVEKIKNWVQFGSTKFQSNLISFHSCHVFDYYILFLLIIFAWNLFFRHVFFALISHYYLTQVVNLSLCFITFSFISYSFTWNIAPNNTSSQPSN